MQLQIYYILSSIELLSIIHVFKITAGSNRKCDFESHVGLCPGWIQSSNDDLDWTTMKGPTPSGINDSTGPDTDHTLQTAGAFSVT